MAQARIGTLFVCLGNICRSPAAEGTFAHVVKQRGLEKSFHIDSCGTSAYHIGEPANANSRKTAKKYGIDLTSRARQFERGDFRRFDYIFPMDASNFEEVLALAPTPEDEQRVWMFRGFDPEVNDGNGEPPRRAAGVPDPYYGGMDGFENVQQILLRTSERLVDWLMKRHLT